MSEPATATVADRLASAGLRVKPLVWAGSDEWSDARDGGRYYVIEKASVGYTSWIGSRPLHRGTRDECIAACDAHNAAAVLANLEVVPSEETQP